MSVLAKASASRAQLIVVRIVQVLAVLEAIDAVIYLSQSGWFSASPWLIALTAGGILGAVLVLVARAVPWIAGGALLVAAAPAIVYPLSIALVVLAVVLMVMAFTRRRGVASGAIAASR